MKKYLFLLVLFFMPLFVYADACNNNDIVISNVTMVDSKGDVEEISSPEIVNTGVSTNLRLYNVGDSITYNIKIKNNSKEDYVLNKNISNSNNVTYEIISDNNKIKSKEEKTISLRITYSKDIDKSLFNNGKYVENKEINVILDNNVVNPNTGLNKIIIVLVLLFFFLLSSLVIRKDIKYLSVFIIFFIPLLVKASCQYQIKINSNIEFSVGQKCVYDGELVPGAEYVNGQYTYRYRKVVWKSFEDTHIENINDDGWSVMLTDKESTDPVTSTLCSSINNKPIVSMKSMFSESQATSIDLSSFDTSNVTDMSGMFGFSSAVILDLSSFDTSNVTNMSSMFSGSKATTINLSSFNTSNVTDMNHMFSHISSTTIDLRSFNFNSNMIIDGAFYNQNLNVIVSSDSDVDIIVHSIPIGCHSPRVNIYVNDTLKYAIEPIHC